MCESLHVSLIPHFKQVASLLMKHSLSDNFQGEEICTIYKSKTVLVFVGGQSRVHKLKCLQGPRKGERVTSTAEADD